MSDFNFSLFWGVLWFLLVYYILTRVEKRDFERYIDGVVIAFFSILLIWFIGAFFWGQVYGRETQFGIEVLYNKHSFSPVPFQVPIFPLPLVYALLSFLMWIGLYILTLFVHIKGFVWYIGLILFSAMILVLENFSGKADILYTYNYINFPQVCALVLALWSWYKLHTIMKKSVWEREINHTHLHDHQ